MRPTRGTHEVRPVICWAIAGPGEIATCFAEGMRESGWRHGGRRRFVIAGTGAGIRSAFEIPRPVGSYDAVGRRPRRRRGVRRHAAFTARRRHVAFLFAGEHVLCEKPFALNATQANESIAAAERGNASSSKQSGLASSPPTVRSGDLLAEGRVVDPLLVEASFGGGRQVDPTRRHFDRAGRRCAARSWLYTVNLSPFMLVPVESVAARSRPHHRSGRTRRRGTPARRRSTECGSGRDPHATHLHRAHRLQRRRDRPPRLHALSRPFRRAHASRRGAHGGLLGG